MIAITGASGRLGSSVARALLARGIAEPVRLGTRNQDAIAELTRGSERTKGCFADFDDPRSLVALMQGARVVLMVCGTAEDDRRLKQHRHAIDCAKDAGVGRLVYVSFVNPSPESLFPFASSHAGTEDYLAASGLPFTVVRNNHYFNNLENALRIARKTGLLSLPGAHGSVAYAALTDIAEAIAEILARTTMDQRVCELSGPESLDLFEVAQRASKVWGSKVRAADMSAQEYRALLARHALPTYSIEAQIGIRLACGAGEYDRVSDDIECLLNRPPRKLDTFLERF